MHRRARSRVLLVSYTRRNNITKCTLIAYRLCANDLFFSQDLLIAAERWRRKKKRFYVYLPHNSLAIIKKTQAATTRAREFIRANNERGRRLYNSVDNHARKQRFPSHTHPHTHVSPCVAQKLIKRGRDLLASFRACENDKISRRGKTRTYTL